MEGWKCGVSLQFVLGVDTTDFMILLRATIIIEIYVMFNEAIS